MYLQKVKSKKIIFLLPSGRSLTKIAGSEVGYGSGSVSHRYGSTDPQHEDILLFLTVRSDPILALDPIGSQKLRIRIHKACLFRSPLGVCAGIAPFNFPAMIPLWMFPTGQTGTVSRD
jgi:hypothetical protein